MDWKKIAPWITIIGSFASVIALTYIFYPKPGSPLELEFTLESCDNLTTLNDLSEPEIKAKFEYKGTEIFQLWRINIILENKSDETIIGSGQLKNILSDNIYFFLSPVFQVIDKKMIKSDFNHTLRIINFDTLSISFSQWRSSEQIQYSLYLKTESLDVPNLESFQQPLNRQIIDGDIIFKNLEEIKQTELKTDVLGRPTKMITYGIIILVFSLLSVVFFIIIISSIVGFLRRKTWHRNNYHYFVKYITPLKIPKKDKDYYIVNPDMYPNWDKYPGNRYPDEWGMEIEITKTFTLITTVFFLLVLTFAQIVVLMDLIQLIP